MTYTETIKWNTIEFRTMTDDEIEDLSQLLHVNVEDIDKQTFDCQLPDLNEKVLLKTKYGISISYFIEADYGVYFEDFEPEEIIAWAQLPTGEKTKEETK